MPLFDPATAPQLRPWLVRTLEPICDADPEVLADYVLALLKHDAPEAELRTSFVQQLEDFLDKEGPGFVDQLFAALRSKSYMPYAPASPRPSDSNLPERRPPHQTAGQKRAASDEDYERGPNKGPRLNGGDDNRFARNGDGARQDWRGGGGPRNGGGPGHGHGPGPGFTNGGGRDGRPMNNQRGPREPCRDYHTRGFCPRGAMCPFSHDNDAIQPQLPFGMPAALPFMQMMAAGAPFGMFPMNGPFDPTQQDVAMAGVPPGMQGPGPIIQDLTPQGPGRANGGGDRGRGRGRGRGGRGGGGFIPAEQTRGTFVGDAASFDEFGGPTAESLRPKKGENKTLVIEKIPAESLTLAAVNDWFKRFGNVTNVAVDVRGGKALVTFQEPYEAHAAWKSEDAVFNNRFVKVFWHRPLEGRGTTGSTMLAASAPLLANMTTQIDQSVGEGAPPTATPTAPPKKKVDAVSLAAKQQLLERQIAEQKTLMDRYSTAATAEEKKEIMTRLRQLNEEMKSEKATAPASTADPEQQERERLDKELQGDDVEMATEGSSTEDLKAKLARLKAEAASLGMDPNAHSSASYRGGFRGRARGARGFRGRGGAMPMRSMKLDNRPKKLLVKGTTGDDEALSSVQTHYNTMGQVESATLLPSGDILVGFTNRSFAEQAIARPSTVSGLGTIDVSWYADSAPAVGPTASTSTGNGTTAPVDGNEDSFMHERDEERDDGGWEDDDDDLRRRR